MTPRAGSAMALNAPVERSSELRFLHPGQASVGVVMREWSAQGAQVGRDAPATFAVTDFPLAGFVTMTVLPQSGALFDPVPY